MTRYVVKLRKTGEPWHRVDIKTRDPLKALGAVALYVSMVAEGKLSDLSISRQESRRKRQ